MTDPQVIQRLLVRMHVDPEFVAKVHSEVPLPEIEPRVRTWLRAIDARAFLADDTRAARLLHAAIDEFPVTSACLPIPSLRRFFSSTYFHQCVMQRGSLVLSYGEYLQTFARVETLARFENCLATSRRREVQVPASGQLVLASRVGLFRGPASLLSAYEKLRATLGADPVAAIVQGKPRTPPTLHGEPEDLLVQGSGVGKISDDLAEVLALATSSIAVDKLRQAFCARGASKSVALELIDELVSDAVLVRG